jgi:hypothetical protein
MSLEKDASALLRPCLKPLHGKRIENLVEKGTPDWNYANGWIELKNSDRWPVRGGRMKPKNYTPEQRLFQHKRGKVGNVFLLWRVGKEWYLFGPEFAFGQLYLEGVTRQEAIDNCIKCWMKKLNGKELRECLN